MALGWPRLTLEVLKPPFLGQKVTVNSLEVNWLDPHGRVSTLVQKEKKKEKNVSV